jgi:hypothetical protein
LLAALPSYLPVYEELAARLGDNFSVAELVAEVAKEAGELLSRARDRNDEARLELIADALERLAVEPRIDASTVIEAFLSSLPSTTRPRFDAYLGPASHQRADHLGERDGAVDGRTLSRAAPHPLRPRPRRYSGRGPRRRRRL